MSNKEELGLGLGFNKNNSNSMEVVTDTTKRSTSSTSTSITSNEDLFLQYECGHNGHILALYLKAHGDNVLVGDLLRSVTLLQYKANETTLEEVARDYNSNYMRAVEIIGDEEHFLGADDSGNIFTVRRQSDAATGVWR